MKGYFFIFLVSIASAAGIADLEGTWSTKSRKVITGPVRVAPWIVAVDRL